MDSGVGGWQSCWFVTATSYPRRVGRNLGCRVRGVACVPIPSPWAVTDAVHRPADMSAPEVPVTRIQQGVERVSEERTNDGTGIIWRPTLGRAVVLFAVVLIAVAGVGIAYAEPAVPTLVGTNGDDTLAGSHADDVLLGLGGDDTLRGRQGNDELRGGPGHDLLRGGRGDDRFLCGGGFDVVVLWGDERDGKDFFGHRCEAVIA